MIGEKINKIDIVEEKSLHSIIKIDRYIMKRQYNKKII